MKKPIIFSVAALLSLVFFNSCTDQSMEEPAPDLKLKSYQSGNHDGYFWQLWTDDASGWVDYQNGSGGNYSVSWDYDGNFTCGKGWSSGSATRVVGYNCGVHNHNGGGTFGYYGWSRNPLMEYYVNERWGSGRPDGGTHLGTVSTDGGTYDIYTSMRYNAPSIDGTQTFRQIYSTRRGERGTGQNNTITFANHANAWANAGYGLGSDMSPYAIMLTEAYGGNSDGYVNVTVWESGSSGGGNNGGGGGVTGIKQIRNRGTGMYLDGMSRTSNGSEVGQYANTTHVNAHWNITSAGSGYYYITNQGTNMKLDGYGRTSNGSACAQHSNNTTHVNAQWSLVSAGSGYYYIVNRGTNMKLDGYGRTSNGSACAQYSNSTTHHNAQWELVN